MALSGFALFIILLIVSLKIFQKTMNVPDAEPPAEPLWPGDLLPPRRHARPRGGERLGLNFPNSSDALDWPHG